MVLLASPTSPFTRAVRVLAHERGIELELRYVSPLDDDPELLAHNPIGKVPALVAAGAMPLCDSRSIVAALDPRPRSRVDRWHEAMAHGLMEAALVVVLEGRRPASEQSPSWMARQQVRLHRIVDAVEGCLPPEADSAGALTLGCAMAYLDFRLPALGWQAHAPALAAWQAEQCQRASMRATIYGTA